MSIRQLAARLHPGWLGAAVLVCAITGLVFHTIHYRGVRCDQHLAIDTVRRVDAADLKSIPDGTLVVVHGMLPSSGTLDDGFVDAPVDAVVFERLIQKIETRFGVRAETGSRANLRRYVDTVTEQWTLATEADLLPTVDGQPLNFVRMGTFPERIGDADLWSAEQFVAVWTPLTPKADVITALQAQGYVPDAEAPGFYLAPSGRLRITWRAVMPQPLTWLGAKRTSEFDGRPTIGHWFDHDMSVLRRVYAGHLDPVPEWREALVTCTSDNAAWRTRVKVNVVWLLPLMLCALILALASTRSVLGATIAVNKLAVASIGLAAVLGLLYVIVQIAGAWPLPGALMAVIPLAIFGALMRRTLRQRNA